MPNQRILSVLDQLIALREIQGEDFPVKAYKKARVTIQLLDTELTSGAEAQKLPGIGKSIGATIDAVLTLAPAGSPPVQSGEKTGVTELDALPTGYLDSVLDMTRIPGIGIKKALKYFEQGYRSADQLLQVVTPTSAIRSAPTTPGASGGYGAVQTSTREQIGIKYFKEFEKRIPREKITVYTGRFREVLRAINAKYGTALTCEVAGSYRRGLATSGDIDIIVVSPVTGEVAEAYPTLLATLQHYSMILDTLSSGTDKFEGVARLDDEHPAVRIDLNLLSNPWEYPAALLYFTGSKNFNVRMRQHAKDRGYKLANVEVLGPDGQPVKVVSERAIFELLDYPWVEPVARNI